MSASGTPTALACSTCTWWSTTSTQAREQLAGRGVDVSAVSDMGGVKYAFFGDPDGNTWALQELLH